MADDYSAGEDADEPTANTGYRSYEVYQRERVGETTNLVDPRELIADRYRHDPFTVPGVLRENYPCYRDWVGNRFWVTRFDDVTSVFVDDANFESRPRRLAYGAELGGSDLSDDPTIVQTFAELADATFDLTFDRLLDGLPDSFDVATDVADAFASTFLTDVLGFAGQPQELAALISEAKAGTGWNEQDRLTGATSLAELRRAIGAQLASRRDTPAGDLLTTFADLGASTEDIAVTLLEMDLATLPASLANMWCLLLTQPEQFAQVRSEPRLMKFAYLEALRHSPPIVTADRFARHEVERFGRLLPQGALVHLSAAAANRDPRQFDRPDVFDIARKDLCQREPRGQYRADGLPAAITFGHGKPTRLPAVPRDAPRSRYALTRDFAVGASLALLDRFPNIALATETQSAMSLDRLGGTYRCRSLPVNC